jgi:transposase
MAIQAKRGINMLRSALRRAGVPVYWHKYSPKKYTVHQHAILVVFRRKLNKSYVEYEEFWLPIMSALTQEIGLENIPDQSTFCREEKRLKKWLELTNIKLIQAVLPLRPFASGDGTGLSFSNGSSYYVRRILGIRGMKRKGFARVVFVNTTQNLILGSGLRVLPKGELSILHKIWPNLARKPSTLVWDKAGDSEAHHEWLDEQDVRSIAPVRKGFRRGRLRKQLAKNFPQKMYNKRNHSETTVKLYKQSFGETLKARSLKGRRAELVANTLTHNLTQRLKKILSWMFSMRPRKRHYFPFSSATQE